MNVIRDDGHVASIEEIERVAIATAVAQYDTISEAAIRLGIGRSTLYRKMDHFGITLANERKGNAVRIELEPVQ